MRIPTGLSQQTLIFSYASKRVTSRGVKGPSAGTSQPDVYEYPGFNIDFVARQGFTLGKKEFELKFEARNLTNRKYKETQHLGSNNVVFNLYKPGNDREPVDIDNFLRLSCTRKKSAAFGPPFVSAGPGQLAIPFRDDIFGAAAHFHAVVERRMIDGAVRQAVVPRDQLRPAGA